MARSAVLVGRTVSDILNNAIVIVVMSTTGLVVGWRIRTSVLEAYAMSWVMACVGLLAPGPEVVQQASFIVIFPLTFIANTFAPTEGFPTVLRVLAEWNPVSAVTQAARELFGNTSPALPPPDAWPMQHPVAYTLLWTGLVLAVCVPLAVALYERAASR